ncbi:MAG TPA: hypothetical protein VK856_08435, partial [Anaerolineaceae bacterium]|nr:hypothetical protein [Anaerolineaceae bacterium]
WVSHYYGHKEPALSVQLTGQENEVLFWSFFGDDSFTLEQSKDDLAIQNNEIALTISEKKILILPSDQKDPLYLNPLVENHSS